MRAFVFLCIFLCIGISQLSGTHAHGLHAAADSFSDTLLSSSSTGQSNSSVDFSSSGPDNMNFAASVASVALWGVQTLCVVAFTTFTMI